MTALIQLFVSFFMIGLFAFGGGFAVLSFLQLEVVRHGWMSTGRFVDFIAISQSTPGPIAINMATFVGYEQGGVLGALIASAAVSLPGMILMSLLAMCFAHFYERPRVQSMFRGLRPAVVGLVASAAWQIGQVAVTGWTELAITLASLVLMARWKVGPVVLVVASAVAGILFL